MFSSFPHLSIHQVPSNPFDGDAFRLLCLPRGLLFAKEGHIPDPHFHSFLVTKEDGSRIYGSALTFYQLVKTEKVLHSLEMLQAMYKQELMTQQSGSSSQGGEAGINRGECEFDRLRCDQLYVSQCIAIVSQIPFVWPYEQYLNQLYDVSLSDDAQMPLESYVHNLLFDVPLPPPGRSLCLTGPRGPITCLRPMERSLPLLEYSIRSLFDWLSLDDFMLVFTCFLLEHQILLVASQYHKLMTTAECLSSLMFPFVWQHVYVPILPRSLLHYLDAPVPFLMGLQQLSGDERPNVPGEVITIDLDRMTVDGVEDIPDLPGVGHLKVQLQTKLQDAENSANSSRPSSLPPSLPSSRKQSMIHQFSPPRLEPLVETDVVCERIESNGTSGDAINDENEEPKEASTMPSIHPQLAKMLQLAKKAGIETSISHLLKSPDEETEDVESADADEEEVGDMCMYTGITMEKQIDMDFNNNVREIFLQHFIQLFANYDKFVIPPQSDYDTWLTSREHLENFDKAAFLSDQPESSLPFLSPFLETQSFASLIDNKILSEWYPCDPQLALFDLRIADLKQNRGMLRSPSEDWSTQKFHFSQRKLSFQSLTIDYRAKPPRKSVSVAKGGTVDVRGEGPFAELQVSLQLAQQGEDIPEKRSRGTWSRNQRRLQQWEHLLASGRDVVQEARRKSVSPHPAIGNLSPESMNKSQGSFVLRLLKEARMKVKRLLVQKMGREAFIMGHGELRGKNVTGVEENTLIASLCDLLERIWSHGLRFNREGRSCLWSHLMSFVNRSEGRDRTSSLPRNSCSLPNMHKSKSGQVRKWSGGFTLSVDEESTDNERHSKLTSFKNWAFRSPEMKRRVIDLLTAMPPDIHYDLHCVQKMTEIKTEVGLARAWIRLALEKKQLADHLTLLLLDTELVTERYKDYAFLRSEDEREQLVYHLLSLTTVDFHCFTHGFSTTSVAYRVTFITGKNSLASSTTTANLWFMLAGEHAKTGHVQMPKSDYEVEIKHLNLGLLTTLRVGHDNAGISPGIFIEMVVIRNVVTDSVWKFPCGRWLSRGEDDGSIERLLVGEIVDKNVKARLSRDHTPPSTSHSPKLTRKDDKHEYSDAAEELLQDVADAVNQMIKHCSEPEAHGSLSFLLCGEKGMCQAMHNVFLHSMRSRRFRSNLLPWDFIQKVYESLNKLTTSGNLIPMSTSGNLATTLTSGNSATTLTSGNSVTMSTLGDLSSPEMTFMSTIARISSASTTIGKDGKFQTFVCLAARDNRLADWMSVLGRSSATELFYHSNSFFRRPELMSPLLSTLSALNDTQIKLESSILQGIDDD